MADENGVRHVALGSTRIGYRRLGSPAGSTILLLHPWFGCPGFWEPVLPALAGQSCLIVDLYSPSRGAWQDVANARSLAAAMVDVLDAEGATKATVVGNSMGGIIAQILAAEYPDRVAKLVLVGTGATSRGMHSQFAESLAAWMRSRDSADLESLTRSLVAPRAARHRLVDACVAAVAAVDPEYLAAIPRATLGLDLRPLLDAIEAPTLVLRGKLDSIRTRGHADELTAGIRGAKMVEIRGAGHSPMVDSTAAFNRLLLDFLSR